MTTLPSWYPWGETETKPAPMPLLLVQAFVNTHDLDHDLDLLADPESARAWFVDAGLLDPEASLRRRDLQLARAARESVRGLLESSDRDLTPLREIAGDRSPRLAIAQNGKLTLETPRAGDIKDGLLQLLLIIRAAQEDGTWSRLHVCTNDDCRWAFYDRSRNQQGQWCDMATCGNRLKNREFRARRRR